MEGGVIAGFHGGVGKFITAIGVFLVPKVNSTPNSEKKVDSLHSIQDPDSVPTQLKGKISNEEGWISLGPWGGKDGVEWAYKPNGPIMQISICYGEVINSILFRSRSCDGLLIGSSQEIGNTGGHTTETFCIQSSVEQLLSIRMTYDEDDGKATIVSLCFYTNLNKYGPFGTTNGSCSLIIPMEGGVIAGFHGRRVDTYLTAIGIFLTPKVNSLHPIQDPDYTPINLKAKISGEEGWISLGPWGGNGGVDWAYKPDGPIMQISIRYGEVIESILFESRSCDDIVIGSSVKIGNMGGYATKKFCIKSSEEQLSSIEMTFDDDDGKLTIVSLCFNTNRKKYGPFGSKSGGSSVSIPIDGGFIAGFHGRIDTYLTAIGIFVAPKVNSLHSVQGPDFAPTQLKDKISDEEGCISLGPWGGEDGVDWAYKYDGPIMQIYICYGAAIDSLLFRSRSCDGLIIGSSETISEGGVVTGFHGRTDTYLTAIGIFLAPKVSSLSIQDPDSMPSTQLKVPDSGVGSKPKPFENVIQNAASSSATSNKDDDRRGAPSQSSEMISKDLHLVTEQKKALQLVDSAFHMDKQISESEFAELGEAIEKLKFQIPLTSTNKGDHSDGVLSPTSKMIRSDLILVNTAFAKANEAMCRTSAKINKAHEKFKELQTLQRSARDPDELRKAESDQKQKELRKAIAKLKVQTSSHSEIRSAYSNLHRNNWPNINRAKDGMMHFFYKEPDVAHTVDDGLLEAFRKLSEPLRCCLSCFFKFPPMATIKRTPMIYLWIGQGYVSQYLHSEGYDLDVEELADRIFDDLIEKGFIEPIYQNFSLVPDSCKMSLTVHSSLYEEAKLTGFTSNANGALDLDSSAVCRDLIQHSLCLINVGEAIINCEPEIFKNMKAIRSLYLGRWQSSATHHIELEDAKLLHGLCKLKSLTFLSLRGISMIMELPKSILELNDLMILDLRACSNLEVIPDKIGLLKRLTHLDMSECYFLENMPKSLAQLSNLQVLKGFLIGDFNNKKQSCTLHDLSGLQKLRKLNIHISVEDLLRLQDLKHLESFVGLKKLKISWGRLQARAEVISEAFHSATIPPRLEKLDLQCFPMTSLSNWLMPGKLKELKKLYITGGKLRDLGEIQKRQKEQWTMEILRFEYLGELELYWKELSTLFPKLIYLRQVECPNFMDFQCDERGVWMKKEVVDTHVQLQKYLKTSMISSRAMSGSGPTLAQDHSNICPADEK
ncbi:hypothetical protein Vadar_012526 [Vaccinium darrowii]|uniref:Uncharacterized protein n=1 Tax=Vaccinium darrowii TaxID=229202 RepID=A0ACB7X052_9ERIC|nr:hypothetical protein Vadar_012526 [Vaccinium darrowii]